MEKYLSVVNTIYGWFEYEILCPLLELINNNQEKGNILEIGIHHGKSFIPMITLLRDNEIAVAVDVFDDQHLNYDHSGEGNLSIFKQNIKKIYNNDNIYDKIKIIKNDSTKLNSRDYLCYTASGENYRIISIDGCHTKDATLIDLTNATKILSKDGIIILDDYFNNTWPGVKFAIDTFMEKDNTFRLVYLNANKFIICHKNSYTKYINLLKDLPNNFAIRYEQDCWKAKIFKQ